MKTTIDGVRIAGIASAVPSTKRTLNETAAAAGISEQEAGKIAKMTGIKARYVAPQTICTSDLSFAAAEQLFRTLPWERDSIDALLFVSQTPDFALPATACLLHEQLQLSDECAALDISLGCSGYVYGLWTAANMVKSGSAKRVLLLVGDTCARYCSPQDRSTAFLFGDAGTATAIEYDPSAEPMSFVLGTDGKGGKSLIRRGGGARHVVTPRSLVRQADENGNVRGPLDLYMDGAEVFSFTLERVPALVEGALQQAGWSLDELDHFVPHQANLFLLNHLAKRMKVPADKLVVSLDEYGNTSSASIPLAIGHRLASQLSDNSANLLLAGFGVGWSWGAVALRCGPMVLPPVVHVPAEDLEFTAERAA